MPRFGSNITFFRYLEIDLKARPSEPYLKEFIYNLLSTLLVVPVSKMPVEDRVPGNVRFFFDAGFLFV